MWIKLISIWKALTRTRFETEAKGNSEIAYLLYCPGDRISNLFDLWVIKIKSLWSFARVVRQDKVNRTRNADHAARTCERFVYINNSQNNKIVWLSNMADIYWEIHEVRKGMWAFFLDCALRALPIGWAGILRSRGCVNRENIYSIYHRFGKIVAKSLIHNPFPFMAAFIP